MGIPQGFREPIQGRDAGAHDETLPFFAMGTARLGARRPTCVRREGLPSDVRHTAGARDYIPDQRRRLRHQNQEDPREGRVGGPVLFGELVLVNRGGTVRGRNVRSLGMRVHPATETVGRPRYGSWSRVVSKPMSCHHQ